MRRKLCLAGLVLCCLVGALALSPRQASACSCVPPGSPVEELSQSAAVFAGQVVGMQVVAPAGGVSSSADPVRFTFVVQRVWKGPAQASLVVETAASGASCGYEFQRGQDYLVYARGTPAQLTASLCSRTAPLDAAGEDLSALGEGVAVPQSAVEKGGNTGIILAAALGGAVLVAAVAILYLNRKRA